MRSPGLVFRLSAVGGDLILRWLYRLRVYGADNVPAAGGAIVAINHASYMDPAIAGPQVGLRRWIRGIGKKELFQVPILGAYLRALGSFPLDRDRSDMGAMRAALSILDAGDVLLMAPEGTRGKSGRPRTPKPGVAFLAHKAGVPVVPARVGGTEGFPLPGRLWIRFGRPVRFAPRGTEAATLQRDYREFAEALMRRIYAMTEAGEPPDERCQVLACASWQK